MLYATILSEIMEYISHQNKSKLHSVDFNKKHASEVPKKKEEAKRG